MGTEHPLSGMIANALNLALSYGYDELLDWSSEQIAVDLLDHDNEVTRAACEYSVAELVPIINSWRAGLPPR